MRKLIALFALLAICITANAKWLAPPGQDPVKPIATLAIETDALMGTFTPEPVIMFTMVESYSPVLVTQAPLPEIAVPPVPGCSLSYILSAPVARDCLTNLSNGRSPTCFLLLLLKIPDGGAGGCYHNLPPPYS